MGGAVIEYLQREKCESLWKKISFVSLDIRTRKFKKDAMPGRRWSDFGFDCHNLHSYTGYFCNCHGRRYGGWYLVFLFIPLNIVILAVTLSFFIAGYKAAKKENDNTDEI